MSEEYESRTYTPRHVISPEERQRQQINDAVNAAIRTATIQHQNDMANLRKQHDAERQQLNQRLNTLNSQFKDVIIQHQQQLDDMRKQHNALLSRTIAEAEQKRQQDRKRFEQELNEAIDIVEANVEDLRKSTQRALDATNMNLDSLRVETRRALNEQQNQINSIVEEVHNDKAKAAAIKKALSDFYEEQLSIIRIKNYQKYAPNQLDAIEARLKGIDRLPDVAACAVLNTAFNDLLTLDTTIEQAKMEYETKHILTLKAAEEVLARMHENRNTVTLTDGDNNVVTDENGCVVKLELDFWSEGEYGKLETQLSDIITSIKQGLNDPKCTIDDLDQALKEIRNIDKQQNEWVVESIQRGNASQIRAEMADVIAEHLEEQRFQVVERGYENGDARNAYFIKLNDGESEIVIAVNPESNDTNNVIRKTIETELSEPALIQRNKDIDNALEKVGIRTSGGACKKRDLDSDEAWREIYDMKVVCENIPFEIKERARLKDVRKEQNRRNG